MNRHSIVTTPVLFATPTTHAQPQAVTRSLIDFGG